MSEELTGRDSVEQGLGGRQPLPEWNPPAADEPKTYDSGGIESAREAANDHTQSRGAPTEDPIIKIVDKRHDSDSKKFYTTAEDAGKELSDYHAGVDAEAAAENLNELAAGVDRAREWANGQQPQADAQQQPAQAEAPAPIDSPQPEAGEAPPSGLSPKVAAALADPEIRQAIEASIAPAHEARQQYEQGLAQVTQFAAAGVLAKLQSKYPSITGPQIPAAMQLLESQDPQFFAEIRSDANRALGLVQASQQVQAQQEHANHQRFLQWSKAEDAKVEAAIPGISNDPDMKVSKAAIKTLKDVGFDESDLAKAWHGEVALSLRDHRAQLLIYKASRYDQIQATAHANPASRANIPPVHRPGIAPSAGERSSVDLSQLRNEFKRASGNEQLRLGAKLMRLQRGG